LCPRPVLSWYLVAAGLSRIFVDGMSIFTRLFQKEEDDRATQVAEGPDAPALGDLSEAVVEAFREKPTPLRGGKTRNQVSGSPSSDAGQKLGQKNTIDPGRVVLEESEGVPVNSKSKSPPSLPPPQRRASPPRKVTAPPPANAGRGDSSIDEALDRIFPTNLSPSSPASAPPSVATLRSVAPHHGASTPEDKAAARDTFEDLAIGHLRPVRNLMIELMWGGVLSGWADLARPALESLRQMGEPLELTDLCRAAEGFRAAVDEVASPLWGGGVVSPEARLALIAAYQPLQAALPRVFSLDGDRDRREPIIVRGLLRQVAGLEPHMIPRLSGVGLGSLDALLRASAEEIEVVAGLPPVVAAALVDKVQELRRAPSGGLAGSDARRALQAQVRALETSHHAYEKAAAGWSSDSVTAKREHRRARELTYLEIMVALARSGEVELANRLEPLPFARRIEELDRMLSETGVAHG
jgi:hypothetical protein